ncbi:MAG: hypothetical protein HOO96_26040 [Polyangiaceae bacterium]|nr:hypothetical protein [Polyangiaceae bacterium]
MRASAATLAAVSSRGAASFACILLAAACGIELSGGGGAPRDATGGAGKGQDVPPDAAPFDAGNDVEPLPFPTVVQLAAAADRTCAVEARGALKCWGRNTEGQLGLGDTLARGDDPNEMGRALPAVDLGASAQVAQVALGGRHTCAILGDSSLRCWGFNATGELGLGDFNTRGDEAGEMGAALPAVNLGSGHTAKEVATGYQHTCAILDDGTLRCWGLNAGGQLGAGNTRNRGGIPTDMGDVLRVDLGTGRTAKHVTAGAEHTCAILDNDDVKCWGANTSGQLGYGDFSARGDGVGEMGDALKPVDIGPGRKVRAVGAGMQHTCALLDDETVKCWGNTYYGQCGTGDTNNRGDSAGEMGGALRAIDLGQGHRAKGIGVGSDHTCVALDNDELRCFGAGFDGQVGPLPGGFISWGWAVGQMGQNLPSIDVGPSVKVLAVSAGGTHTCAVLGNQVKCFGSNAFGGLGQGDTKGRGRQQAEMGAALAPISVF